MPVINAHCPTDQANLKALYAHKAVCFSRYKDAQSIENDVQRIFAMNRLADRRSAVEAIAVKHGEAYQSNVKARLGALTAERKAQSKAQLAASKAQIEALNCLESA